jgi:drug/metabolite transporter (DMT)-like permease
VQSTILVTALAIWRPTALLAVARSWRPSVGAGFFGAAASACWFAALALAPAGPVRAVGVIEMPIAAAAGRRLFKERMTVRRSSAAAAAAGVAATALG